MQQNVDEPRAWMTSFVREDGCLVVEMRGEYDIASVTDIVGEIETALHSDARDVLVDMSELRFMDSSGVAVLIRLANHFGPLTLAHVSPLIHRTLEALGLIGRFRVSE